MDKAVLTAWAVYLAGLALYPLVEALVSRFSSSRDRYLSCDREFEAFPVVVRSVFWPVIAVGWLCILWAKTLDGAGEWVYDKLVEYKHRRDK